MFLVPEQLLRFVVPELLISFCFNKTGRREERDLRKRRVNYIQYSDVTSRVIWLWLPVFNEKMWLLVPFDYICRTQVLPPPRSWRPLETDVVTTTWPRQNVKDYKRGKDPYKVLGVEMRGKKKTIWGLGVHRPNSSVTLHPYSGSHLITANRTPTLVRSRCGYPDKGPLNPLLKWIKPIRRKRGILLLSWW